MRGQVVYLRYLMSEFVVSARKYRPVRFDEVVGQQHVSQTLKNALRQNRLAHAFLFCGPRGVGKTTNARILAKVLNCLNVSEDYEPCNICANCVAFNQNASFNIFELDGASNNKVDHMHQLMEQVRVPPQSGRKKVYIIDEVHMLSQSAFNAFLKTLEEPPDYAIFILATTEKHKILPTILSRCQVYDFHRIKPADMVAHLEGICSEEGLTAEPEALHLIAEKADGALRDALSIFDRLVSSAAGTELTYAHAAEQLNVLDHSTFFEVVEAMLREDIAELYLQFDQVLSNGFEAEPFLAGLSKHLRQLFVCKSPTTLKLLEVSEALRQRYASQASKCDLAFLVNALNLAAECDFRIRMSTNKRLHVELYLVKMAFAQRTIQRDGIAVPGSTSPAVLAQAAQKKSEPAASNTEYIAQPAYVPTKQAETNNAKVEVDELGKSPKVLRDQINGAASLSISFDESEDEDEVTTFVKTCDLSLAQLQEAWKAAADAQPKRIRSIMRRAKLDYADPKLTARVGSLLAQNTLRTEATNIREIKDQLNCPDLNILIEFDESLAPKVAPPRKVLGASEKYQILIDTNPQVADLTQRFGLKLDE